MTTSQESLTDTVCELVDQQLKFSVHGYKLGHDDDLWKLGMTSLTCMGLMLSIEDGLEIEFPEELLKESTFRSVNTITAAVEVARQHAQEGVSSAT